MSYDQIAAESSQDKHRSRRDFLRVLGIIGAAVVGAVTGISAFNTLSQRGEISAITIPQPSTIGTMSVEQAIRQRRSVRGYSSNSITLDQLSQLLWAAQGITDTVSGFRSAPSAGATYPLELYAVVKEGGVENLAAGVYHYEAKGSILSLIKTGDFSKQLQSATLNQDAVSVAAVVIVTTAVFARTTARYGDRGNQYVFQESGHAAQNIYLQATAMGLGTVVIGAFDENNVRTVIGAQSSERPVYVQPLGALA